MSTLEKSVYALIILFMLLFNGWLFWQVYHWLMAHPWWRYLLSLQSIDLIIEHLHHVRDLLLPLFDLLFGSA